MKKALLFTVAIICSFQLMQSQSFGIGTDTPNPASILDIVSTNKGVLIPRLTNAQRSGITPLGVAQRGLLIYNTSSNEFNYWDGSAWVAFPSATVDTDDQQIDVLNLNGTDLEISLQDDGVATQTLDLSPLTEWTDGGDYIYPTDGISESVSIGTLTDGTGKLNIHASNETLGIYLSNSKFTTSAIMGISSSVTNSGTGLVTGIRNSTTAVSSGDIYGFASYVNGSSTGSTSEHHGLFSSVTSNGNGDRYGIRSYVSGTGSGDKYSLYANVLASSGGTHYGVYSNVLKANSWAGYFLGDVSIGTADANIYTFPASRGANGEVMQTDATGQLSWVDPSTFAAATEWTDNGTYLSPTDGTNEDIAIGGASGQGKLNITSNNKDYSIQITNSQSGAVEAFGIRNYMNASTTSTLLKAGIQNYITTSSTGSQYGVYNYLDNNSIDSKTGTLNTLVGITGAEQTGTRNGILTNGNGTHSGTYNSINGTGTGTHYGVQNRLNGSGSGERIGTYNFVYGSATGDQYGTRNYINSTSASTGTKYGSYNYIRTSAGGIHYGVYSEALKTSNAWAGYFLGDVSIGTSAANIYTFPASRGTNGQIMQTNGTGTVSWVSPTAVFTDTDNQTIDYFNLLGSTLYLSLEDDAEITQSVDLSSLADADWFVESTSNAPSSINDNIYTQGNVGIGDVTPSYPLDITELGASVARGINVVKTDNSASGTNGIYITKTGNGAGRNHGLFSYVTGAGTGSKYGVYTEVVGTGTGNKYGIFNELNTTATGSQYAVRNWMRSNTTAQQIGVFNNLDNPGTGNQYGVYNGLRSTGSDQVRGVHNEFNTTVSADEFTGIRNEISDGTPGAVGFQGMYNNIDNPNDGTYYGVRTVFASDATGTGTKYGSYNNIASGAGGTHYGTYNDVSTANGWATYDIGKSYISNRLSIGETNNADGGLAILKNSSGTYAHILLTESSTTDGARIRFTNNAGGTSTNWTLYGTVSSVPDNNIFNIYHEGSGNVLRAEGDLGLGKIGIANRNPTTNALEVNGNASKSVTGSWLANSDARLKKEIKPLDSEAMLNKVLKMQGVTYLWNDDVTGYERPTDIQYGFVAQDLQEIWPTKVTKDNDGYLQTAYGDYDAMFVESFKALYAEIQSIKKQEEIEAAEQFSTQTIQQDRISQLELENEKLKNELDEIKRLLEQIVDETE